jgi:hypothetical protein
MKTLKLIFCILLISGTSAFAASKKHHDVSVISVKRDIFYFKVASDLVGAHVDVYSANGELIASGEISHRKAIIDFHFENAGTYTIRITKESRVLNFDFKKSSPSPLATTDSEHHVLIAQ